MSARSARRPVKADRLTHKPTGSTPDNDPPLSEQAASPIWRNQILGWGPELFTGGGEMASRLQAFDWADNPLGPLSAWPAELKATLSLGLHSTIPTAIYWGPDLRLLYNDAWSHIPAERHPAAIGRPAAEVWSDIWETVQPQFDEVVRSGQGFSTYDQPLAMLRDGMIEETYWNYSLTPILDGEGRVVGIFNQGHETTDRVLTMRAQAFLLELGDRLRELAVDGSDETPLDAVLKALGQHLHLNRAGYCFIDEEQVHTIVAGNWTADGVDDISGQRFRMADFGSPVLDLLEGGILISPDVTTDERFSESERANFLALSIRSVLIAPVVREGRAIAYLFLNDGAPRRWLKQHADLARDAAERIWDALDRARAAVQLGESQRRFSVIFNQAAVGMSEVDLSGRFVRINDSMGRLIGRDPATIAGLPIADATHPDDREETRRAGQTPGDEGDAFTLEKRYLRPDGSSIWAVTNVTRILDAAGQPSGFFSVTTDVSERKEQERIRGWLLAELNHRVKNNLSTVQALAHQTLLASSSPEEFEATFNARLMALSRAHDLLMRETWTSAALGDLVTDTLAPYALDDSARVAIEGPEIRLSPTAAVTLTLAFHELATNAAKFGALSRPGGRVAVRWSTDLDRNGGVVDLAWRESGGPVVEPPSRRGFGVRLIERGAARELGGTARLDFEPSGVACAFQIPLSQKVMVP